MAKIEGVKLLKEVQAEKEDLVSTKLVAGGHAPAYMSACVEDMLYKWTEFRAI